MARPKQAITLDLARKAEAEIKSIAEHKVCFRLQAIISSAHHPVDIVATVMGVHRSTVFNWIKRFREYGVNGLRDKLKGHNPSKLSAAQKTQVINWLTEGKDALGNDVHWTVARLIDEINRVFCIRVGKTPLWLFMRKSGFRQKVLRPMHAKADPLTQEEFKNR